jgi:hypothetical protein
VNLVIWLIVAIPVGILLWVVSQRAAKRRKAAEQRAATLMAQVRAAKSAPRADATPANAAPAAKRNAQPLAEEWLLIEAATKAAAAGEPALSIQLYTRLLARYPDTSLAAQARAAVEEQKRKLSKV